MNRRCCPSHHGCSLKGERKAYAERKEPGGHHNGNEKPQNGGWNRAPARGSDNDGRGRNHPDTGGQNDMLRAAIGEGQKSLGSRVEADDGILSLSKEEGQSLS